MECKEKIKLPRWAAIISVLLLAIGFIAALINNDTSEDVDAELSPLWILFFPQKLADEEIVETADIPPADVLAFEDENLQPEGVETSKNIREKKKVEFTAPLYGRISSDFGYRQHPVGGNRHFHTGIDIAAPEGTPVRAAAEGKVIFVGKRGGSGNCVILRHYDGYRSYYLHLSKIKVKRGEWVDRGDLIGWVGSTGVSTGPHLHFEIRKNGKPRDPLKLVKLQK